jgi:hypothetical protein
MRTQLTKEQVTELLRQSQERSVQRYHEEFRKEHLERLRAEKQKEAEIVMSDELLY